MSQQNNPAKSSSLIWRYLSLSTGEIRSNSTDDIACWFIDADYNDKRFIVRHAYCTGADNPHDKLKRALRTEIDESAWSALYST